MAISWHLKKPLLRCHCCAAAHNYRVRQRLGWSHLRDVLIQVRIELPVGTKFTMTLTGAKLPPVQQPQRHLLHPPDSCRRASQEASWPPMC